MTNKKNIAGVLGGLAAIVTITAGTMIVRDYEKEKNRPAQTIPQYIHVPLSDKIIEDIKKGKSVNASSYMFKTMILEKNKDGTTTYKEIPQYSFK